MDLLLGTFKFWTARVHGFTHVFIMNLSYRVSKWRVILVGLRIYIYVLVTRNRIEFRFSLIPQHQRNRYPHPSPSPFCCYHFTPTCFHYPSSCGTNSTPLASCSVSSRLAFKISAFYQYTCCLRPIKVLDTNMDSIDRY